MEDDILYVFSKLQHKSQTAKLCYETDWSKTDLGPTNTWSESLKTTVKIVLTSKFPMYLLWGPERIGIYNDGYIDILGTKRHPAIGKKSLEVWLEVYSIIKPMIDGVFETGEPTFLQDNLLLLENSGKLYERYFSWSYSPVYNKCKIDGVLCTVFETTDKIISDRRMRYLRHMATHATNAVTLNHTFELIASSMSNIKSDLSFISLYEVHDSNDGKQVISLKHVVDIEPCKQLSPITIETDPNQSDLEKLFVNTVFKTLRTGNPELLDLSKFDVPISTMWKVKPTKCVILPIKVQDETRSIVVAAINPYLNYNDTYNSFFLLMASQISSIIAAVLARIEERKRTEKLAEIDRTKTEFFNNISHEFRTPLTLMLGPLEDLINEDNSDKISKLQLIHRNALRLLKLVNTLLGFARIESERQDAIFTPVDLKIVSEDLVSVFRAACERVGLELITDCQPMSQSVYVDVDLWEKIMFNLLSNAFKYTMNGKIVIKLSEMKDQNCVELSVEDTGTGIPPEEMDHIFKRFHRVKGVHGRSHEGTGIGLAFVYELVKIHGGTISATSELNKGTKFTVQIPLGISHLPEEQVRKEYKKRSSFDTYSTSADWWLGALNNSVSSPSPRLEKELAVQSTEEEPSHILVVDDNADMRSYISKILKKKYNVQEAVDGIDALEKIEEKQPDLILTDIMMPRMDGLELLKTLRKNVNTNMIPVVFLSARAGEESQVEGIHYLADDYVVKPFTKRELVARVQTHLKLNKIRFNAAKQVELANKARDHLAILSHELRTPLTPALMLAESLATNDSVPIKIREDCFMISRNIKLEVQLIDDLLDITKLFKNKLVINEKPVDIHDELLHTIKLVGHDADSKNIKINIKLEAINVFINGDSARIQQIFWNIIKNAVKFTNVDGHIDIKTINEMNNITIKVKDSGIGFENNAISKMFEPFEQVNDNITRKFGGLGIGLSITKGLVVLHNGSLKAQSKGLNQGSTFSVTLPNIKTPDTNNISQIESLTNEQIMKKVTILLVEDNKSTLLVMQRMLKRLGHNIITAMSIKEAFEQAENNDFDIVISDIGLPDGSGHDLMEKLLIMKPKLVGIAASGFGTQEDINKSLTSGFYDHITKPIELFVLKSVINNVISHIIK